MELFKAANQWSTRPADERFWDVTDAHQAALQYARVALEKEAFYRDLRVEAQDGEINLVGRAGVPARLTHHAFGQLSSLSGAPASYLRELPATLAAQNLNHGLKAREAKEEDKAQLLFHRDDTGGVLMRAITSDKYARIWNHEVLDRLVGLKALGWRVPPGRPVDRNDPRARPATEQDVLRKSNSVGGLKIRVGDLIGPSGVYVSSSEMFAFMINEDVRIDDGSEEGLSRGVMLSNSEVGRSSLLYTEFNFKAVCGNHIIWGAQGVREIRVRHVGQAAEKGFDKIEMELRRYADRSISEEQANVTAARKLVLGKTKEEVLDALFGHIARKRIPLAQNVVRSAVDLAEKREADYGDPRTLWANANALTELSQQSGFADQRVAIDTAAGRLLTSVLF